MSTPLGATPITSTNNDREEVRTQVSEFGVSREGAFPLRHTVQQSTKNFALCTLSCSITSFVLVVPLMTFGVWGKVLGRGDKYGCATVWCEGRGKIHHDLG